MAGDPNREHVNIVFIGHVDAGKSTIGGQLMYLTGMVDQRTLEKYLFWALDTSPDEREKGITVEALWILDAPGHKGFIHNMISGAIQTDIAVLVVSARRGEFETGFDGGGQTREHAMLVKTTGVKHLIVLVNKMDDPTVEWAEERYTEIQTKLTPYLRKIGFNPKNDITYIPCSGLTGHFLKERPAGGVGSWYQGLCFLEFLDMLPAMHRDLEGPVRAIVVEKHSDMGTLIIGKLESGVIEKGQNLMVMPNRIPCQAVQCWSGDEEVGRVVAGDSIKLKLKNVEEGNILPGFVICSPEAPCRVGRIFDAEMRTLEHTPLISAGYSCTLHIHAAVKEVRVTRVFCTIDKHTNEEKEACFVRQKEKCILRLESSEPFCLESFEDFSQMVRFTLRDKERAQTIAIGKVVKIVE